MSADRPIGPIAPRPEHAGRERLLRAAVVIGLAAPLVALVVGLPFRARLARDETVVVRASEVWRTMGESLPGSSQQTLVALAFWVLTAVTIAGCLWLIWLAVDGWTDTGPSNGDAALVAGIGPAAEESGRGADEFA